MNTRSWILVVLLTLGAGAALADVFVDDAYWWIAREVPAPAETTTSVEKTQSEKVSATSSTPLSMGEGVEEKHTTITFLDDSITRQNPDTVVRAVIHR